MCLGSGRDMADSIEMFLVHPGMIGIAASPWDICNHHGVIKDKLGCC